MSDKKEGFYFFLKGLHQKYEDISTKLSNPDIVNNKNEFKELSKELSRLSPLNEKYLEFKKVSDQRDDAAELIEISDEEELIEMAEEEIRDLDEKLLQIENEIKVLMVADEVADNRNVFLEIRAGAGGNEASLFASDLLRMYTRVAERQGWKLEIVSTNLSAIGGIKEIIIYIKGKKANKYLKYESGVHRVQRVPVTESSGRIHTSTVTVAVMSEVDDIEVEINAKDIRIDTYRASGAGGQHVNKTESAVRITHFPSSIVVSCQDESSQHKNKDKAMKMLKSKLYDFEQNKQKDDQSSARREQVGSGDRSEKIRTYNFPQSRVTDHRVSEKNFNTETVLDGSLDELVRMLTDYFTKILINNKLKEILS